MKQLYTKRYIQTLTVLLLASLIQFAYAALPATLNYQGHLTSNSGAPFDGAVDMVFAIYDVESGGTALWSESK